MSPTDLPAAVRQAVVEAARAWPKIISSQILLHELDALAQRVYSMQSEALLARVRELEERLERAKELQRLTEDNEIRWMRQYEAAEAEVRALAQERDHLRELVEEAYFEAFSDARHDTASVSTDRDDVQLFWDASLAKRALEARDAASPAPSDPKV